MTNTVWIDDGVNLPEKVELQRRGNFVKITVDIDPTELEGSDDPVGLILKNLGSAIRARLEYVRPKQRDAVIRSITRWDVRGSIPPFFP